MTSKLPASLPVSPADALVVNSPPLRVVIRSVTGLAERFGWWKQPLPRAATETGEMSALDNLYWIHKSRHPVCEYERAMDPAKRPDTDLMQIALPEGMEISAEVTIGAAGDMLRSPGIEASRDVLFEKVSDLIFDQDIAFSNYESPVTTQPLVEEVIGDAGPPVECSGQDHFDIFKGHQGRNFDILHTANNHMYDMGAEGIETTLVALREAGILPLGSQSDPVEYGRAVVYEQNGIRIGFVSDCFGLNGRTLAEEDRHRIHVSKLLSKRAAPDLTLLKRQIDDALAQGCDFVIASVHWGYEFEFFPREVQIDAARELVEYGADSLICHHPHVIQPVEVYRTRRDPERLAVIAYSLGSLTWSFMAPHIVLSTILNLKLAKGKHGDREVTYVASAKATPVFRSYVEEQGRKVTRIEKLSDHDQSSPFDAGWIKAIRDYATLVLGPGGSGSRS